VNRAPLHVQLIAWTHFTPPTDVAWSTDADGGQALAEFAGRACYQSWKKPNPKTATNAGYLEHILETGHFSVLEHGSVSFYFSGISRSLTHELIRHRHFSYSQLSQRYVPERDAAFVEPDIIAGDPDLHKKFEAAADASLRAYSELLEGLEARIAGGAGPVCPLCGAGVAPIAEQNRGFVEPGAVWFCVPCGYQLKEQDVVRPQPSTADKKAARQAARAILPNATETRIVVTGNYRVWRHFIALRATEHADVEIRAAAIECLRKLQAVAPNVFADFVISELDDGSEVAASPHAERS
jgi:thymidylate synthase (FAD)